MRLTLTLVFAGLLLTTTACAGGTSAGASACEPPKVGQVLGVCDGTVAISLGLQDGVRPGDTLEVVRGRTHITTIVIHDAKNTQAAGTTTGVSEQGGVHPGDAVVPYR